MRVSATRDVAIITPWYPTRQVPFGGAFVRAMVEATATVRDRATVFHCDGWGAPVSRRGDRAIVQAHQALLTRGVRKTTTVTGADLVYLPVPVHSGLSYAEAARRHSAALGVVLGGRPIDAPVVHGHVGLRGGWTALENARPDARVFVTEHATFLPAVLRQPDSRAMYDEVIRRAAGFFAVGEAVRSVLVEAFPQHAERIGFIPNPVDFGVARQRPVTALRRWLYVGSLNERKGVALLLEAFARCRADDPGLTLTFVGDGPLRASLTARAAALGIADAVTFAGFVLPTAALELMHQHDLLVHPSRLETFGMTVVEAIAAGMPVLVTRCGGPEETLAGIEDAAGGLIAVDDDPDTIVAGYRRIRDRFPEQVDLRHAREVLADRYGYPSVARAHRRAWFPDPAGSGPVPVAPEAALNSME
ncbi:glycosyltransferase family 4 protein [Plantactinospora soyae]|uniref:Glycogen(Starch) synthase n=1 Tax=Plantactinospora soyae TaxID=1544732 RepID=A0A927M849_9ACTN|nr:glycosyltransferase family 4 protein [Plantactinospora soyae]MBE1488675.1 glycogen(starch) synthase [Plantactinospora soyae]